MPTIAASAIISDAQIVLQDATGVRWDDLDELLHWLNDAQKLVAAVRPDSSTVTAAFTCVAGTRQTLPEGATALVDVVRNSTGNAVRKVPRDLMDAHRPAWHTETAAATKHFMYDPRLPREFYVYPPAVADASLTIRYQGTPAEMDALSDTIGVDDMYRPALVDYVVWRALLKDTDQPDLIQRAAAHQAAYERFLGVKSAGDAGQVPQTDPES